MRTLAAALLFVPLALAQLPNPVTSGDHFDISGTVTDAVSAKPLPGAQVTLQATTGNAESRTARTDPSGNFAWRNVPTGVYDLSATRDDYASGDAASKKLILVSGTQPDHFDLALQPQAILTGVVTDRANNPVNRAQVIVLRAAIVAGHRVLRSREEVQTNEHGAFRIVGLNPGPCYVAVAARPPANPTEDAGAYPVTYYPNVTEWASSQVVELRPGAEQQADIKLSPTPAFRISGRVSPTADVTFGLLPLTGAPAKLQPAFDHTFDSNTGAFSLSGVSPGSYILQATCKDRNGRDLSAFRQIALTGVNVSGLNVNINRLPAISGSLHVEGVDNPDQVLSAVNLQAGSDVYSQAVRGSRFALNQSVPPGTYELSADLTPNWYLQSATQGGRDVIHGKVVIADEGSSLPLQFTASPRGATIEATITWPDTGHRVPAHVVVLELNNGEMLLARDTKVVAPNEPAVVRPALIGGIRPGQYVVYAWPEPLTVEYANPEALHAYDGFVQALSIDEGQLVRVALKLAIP